MVAGGQIDAPINVSFVFENTIAYHNCLALGYLVGLPEGRLERCGSCAQTVVPMYV